MIIYKPKEKLTNDILIHCHVDADGNFIVDDTKLTAEELAKIDKVKTSEGMTK